MYLFCNGEGKGLMNERIDEERERWIYGEIV